MTETPKEETWTGGEAFDRLRDFQEHSAEDVHLRRARAETGAVATYSSTPREPRRVN